MMTEQSETDQMLSESEPESDYELELEDQQCILYLQVDDNMFELINKCMYLNFLCFNSFKFVLD